MCSEIVEQKVVDQEIALDSYLSKLLDEIPGDTVSEVQTEAREEPKAIVEKIADNSNVKQKVIVSKQSKLQVNRQQQQPEKVINPLSVMPDWAQHEFQALFFKVDKLILATPLTALLRTIKIDKAPTKIPGQPSWFMGLLDTHEQRIGVLDTGQLVFGKARGQQRDLEKKPFKSILITHDGEWGLACDEILSIGKIEPEKVRWRTFRQKRPWLVGTVIEELTAVIDVNQLVPHRKAG
ncbi:MAG: chemotaxis protein CheW [Methylococcaceae bacterium]